MRRCWSSLRLCRRAWVGIEAFPSAHHLSRKPQAFGHTVKLMPLSYVKAYLKRSKNDANDAAAICEGGNAAVDAIRAYKIRIAAKTQHAKEVEVRHSQLAIRERLTPTPLQLRCGPQAETPSLQIPPA